MSRFYGPLHILGENPVFPTDSMRPSPDYLATCLCFCYVHCSSKKLTFLTKSSVFRKNGSVYVDQFKRVCCALILRNSEYCVCMDEKLKIKRFLICTFIYSCSFGVSVRCSVFTSCKKDARRRADDDDIKKILRHEYEMLGPIR